MANGNDIVINAKATTAAAEKSITALDGKVQKLATTGANNAKAYQMSFAAMQGSVQGVVTKLGGLGVAIAAVVALQKTLNQATKDYAASLGAVGKAEENALNASANRARTSLNALEQLNARAKESPLDPEAIQLENNLVKQLSDAWGEVGLSVNQTTGEVQGLLQATQQINAAVRQQRLAALSKEVEAAQMELDSAQADYNREYGANGEQNISLSGIGNNLRAVGEGVISAVTGEGFTVGYNRRVDARANEYQAKIKEAQARLADLQAQMQALQAETDADNLARVTQQNVTRQNAEKTIGGYDQQEQALLQSLAQAQMQGGDVEAAKAALLAYQQQRDTARYNELSAGVNSDNQAIEAAQRAYQLAQTSGDGAAIADAAQALARVTEIAKQHTDEMAKIAAGQYKPAEAAQTELTRSIARGTFDAFGLGGLGNNIQQQQLDVQKQIERNTKQLAVPVVGE